MSAANAERAPLLDRVHQEFNDALREEAPESHETIWTLLVKRPATLIFILSAMGLITLLVSRGADWFGDVSKFSAIPSVELLGIHLVEMGSDQLTLSISAAVTMNYTVLGASIFAQMTTFVASILGSMDVSVPGRIDVRTNISGNWEHVVGVTLPKPISAEFVPNGITEVNNYDLVVGDLGRDEVVGFVVRGLLASQPIAMRAEFRVKVAKWGIDYTFPLVLEKQLDIPDLTSELVPDLKALYVRQGVPATRALNVTAMLSLNTFDIPLNTSGTVPEMGWNIKLGKCDGLGYVEVCDAHSAETELKDDLASVKVWANVPYLAAEVTAPCPGGKKSPIDTFISSLLAGESSTIVLSSDMAWFGGVDIPFVLEGRSSHEPLVDAITLKNVRFSGTGVHNDGPTAFSGEAVMNVTVPPPIDIDRENVVAAITEIMGVVELYDDSGVAFGRIVIPTWMPTVTLATLEGYEVKCYFRNVPFRVVSAPAFTRVSQALVVYGSADIAYSAVLDAHVSTPVGEILIQKFSMEGETVLRA